MSAGTTTRHQLRDRLKAALSRFVKADGDPKAWAERLRAKEAAGESLTQFQRDAWRAALGHNHTDTHEDNA